MIRWIRIIAVGALVVSLIGLGIFIGLFLKANGGWVAIDVPPWLEGLFGQRSMEAWLPGLIGGWLLAILALGVLLGWSMFYVWRRRQYESLVTRLERELAGLRNLPFKNPAPLEDLDEIPDPKLGEILRGDPSAAEGGG